MAELQLVFNNEKPKNENVGQQSILRLVCRAKSDPKKKIKGPIDSASIRPHLPQIGLQNSKTCRKKLNRFQNHRLKNFQLFQIRRMDRNELR